MNSLKMYCKRIVLMIVFVFMFLFTNMHIDDYSIKAQAYAFDNYSSMAYDGWGYVRATFKNGGTANVASLISRIYNPSGTLKSTLTSPNPDGTTYHTCAVGSTTGTWKAVASVTGDGGSTSTTTKTVTVTTPKTGSVGADETATGTIRLYGMGISTSDAYVTSVKFTIYANNNGSSTVKTYTGTKAASGTYYYDVKTSDHGGVGGTYTYKGYVVTAFGETQIGSATITNVTPLTYTVVYNGNGHTGGSTASSTHSLGVAKTLTSNGFTKTGYTFAGWATSTSGSVVYSNGQSVTNLTSTAGGTVNLYAKWTANTYTVKYNGNGNTSGSTANSTHTYGTAKALTSNGFTRTGYTFAGWATSASGNVAYSNGQSVSNLTSTAGGTVNLYAKWTQNTYTNSIGHWAGGFTNLEGNNSSKTMYNIASTTFTSPYAGSFTMNSSKATTIPNGFYLNSTFGSSSISGSWGTYSMGTNVTQSAGGMYFEYYYYPTTYTISYTLNGGTNHSSNPTSYNVLYGKTLYSPTRTGYTFNGWYNGSTKVTGINAGANATFSSASDMYSKLSSRTTGNLTLSASWTANTYTIKYNGNGNTGGSTASSTHTYGTAKALTTNGFTRTGYTFKGWSTSASGSVVYTNGQSVSNLTSTAGGTVNLYAVWQVNGYKLNVNPNGGTWNGSTASQSFTQNYNTTKAIPNPTRTGYTFGGWLKSTYGTLSNSTSQNSYFSGNNGNVSVYNNSYDGTVTITRESASTPWGSYQLKIQTTSGSAQPGLGGFYQLTQSAANQTYVHTFMAKLPEGYEFQIANNAVGTGSSFTWLTSNKGAGEWETYSYKLTTGSSGTFSSFGFIYVADNGSSSVTWYLASSQVMNITSGSSTFTFGAGESWLTAHWVPNKYYVTLDNQGATSAGTTGYYYSYNTVKSYAGVNTYYYTDSALSTSMGTSITKPTKTGYVFDGYYTGKEGTGTQYIDANGNCINNIYKVAGNTTLYANWKWKPTLDSNYPADATVNVGSTAKFEVKVTTAGKPANYTYQWYYRTSSSGSWNTIGSNSASYTTPATTTSHNGYQYYCVVSNAVGGVSSRTATLTVRWIPTLDSTKPADTTVNSGSTAKFEVKITTAGNPASYTYQWYYRTSSTGSWNKVGSNSASYMTPATTASYNGYQYYCKVTNAAGSVSSRTATLIVRYTPTLNADYPADASIMVGETASFEVKIATAGNPASYTYQWYYRTSSSGSWNKIGGNSASYTTSATTTSYNGYQYYCKVSNAAGSVSSRIATLTVKYKPVLNTTYPQDITVIAGNTAKFEVKIATDGVPASYKYQWYQKTSSSATGKEIKGATGSSYKTAATTKEMDGYYYYCEVTNVAGTVVSRNAKLTVYHLPTLNSAYPKDIVVVEGNNGSFAVKIATAGNPATYTYQWYKSSSATGMGTAISGATNPTYATGKVSQNMNNTYYYCKITNAAGNVNTRYAKLTVYYKPVLDATLPADTTVVIGNKATFKVAIATAGNPDEYTYQWYEKTSSAAEGKIISGATSSTYTTEATTKGMNGYYYYCIVKNGGGQVTSRSAKLTVYYPPVLKEQYPEDVELTIGTDLTFKVEIGENGNPASYTYQWYKATTDGGKGTAINGATNATYTIASAKELNGVYVYCVVTNAGGSVTSRYAKSTVYYLPILDTENPKDVTIIYNEIDASKNTAFMEVSIAQAGSPEYCTYEWFFRTAANQAWQKCDVQTAKMELNDLKRSANGYQFYCEVTNKVGTVDSRIATLTVHYLPYLDRLTKKTVIEGNNVSYEATIATAGNPDIYTYKWYEKAPNSNTWRELTFGTVNGSVLNLDKITRDYNQYSYYCAVTNAAGTRNTNAGVITVHWLPTVKLNDVETLNAGYEANIPLQFTVHGNPEEYSYKWYEKKKGASSFTFMPNQESSVLSLPMLEVENNGDQYYCEITNAAGTVATNIMTLDVRFTPVLKELADQTVLQDKTATFKVEIQRAGNPASYTYQWYCNGKKISGATKSTYTTPIATAEMNQNVYYCAVTNAAGTVNTREATLTVYYRPILAPFYSRTVKEGDNLELKTEIEVPGNPEEYTYQWYKNGKAISGATGSSYNVLIDRSMNGDKYYYVVTHVAGAVTSTTCTLNVEFPPVLDELQDVSVITGETAEFVIGIASHGNPKTYTYEWYCREGKDGEWKLIPSSGTSKCSFVTDKSMNGWQYFVRVSNSGGYIDSNVATLDVQFVPEVSISGDAIVIEGNGTTFQTKIVTDGNPKSYTYQWYRKDANSDEWTQIANASDNIYTMKNIDRSQHLTQYKCEVVNAAGSVFTVPATLYVYWLPEVTNPTNAAVIEGQAVSFSVNATNGNPTIYSYQWYCNNVLIEGATESVYRIDAATQQMNQNTYFCKVTNAAGIVTTKKATLTVWYSPVISGPSNATVIEGNSGNFTVAIAKDGNPASYTYQWYYREGTNAAWTKLNGATGKTLTLNNVTRVMDGYQYFCQVHNTAGYIDSTIATLTVYYLPEISSPSDIYVIEGEKAEFSISVTRAGKPDKYTYQWQYRTGSNGAWTNATTGTGITSKTYTTAKTTLNMDKYQYRCIVTNAAGSVISVEYAILRVYEALEITGKTTVTEGLSTELTVNNMEGVIFSVDDSSLGKITVNENTKKIYVQTFDGHTGKLTITAKRDSNGDELKIVINVIKKVMTGMTASYTGPDIIQLLHYDKADVKIVVYYNNNTTDGYLGNDSIITIRNTQVTNIGDNYFEAEYNGFKAGFHVTGLRPTVIGIRVEIPPVQTEYGIGEEFDKTGMVIVASYNNGTEKEVTNYQIAGSPIVSGQTYVKVVYEEYGTTVTTRCPITVDEFLEVIYPGDNNDGWFSFYELYRIEYMGFRSKTTKEEHPETNGWVDVTQINHTELKEVSIKAGYGFELKVYTNYYTNRSSKVEGTISTNIWEDSYVDATTGETVYSYSTIYPLVTAIKNPDVLYVKIRNKLTGEETKFNTNTDDDTFITMEKTNNASSKAEVPENEELANRVLESRWDNSTKVFELAEREVYEGNVERKIYTSDRLYNQNGSNEYIVTVISPIWYGYDWEAGTDAYGYFVKNYTSKAYSNGHGSLQVCMSFQLNIKANNELHTHILQ